LHIWAGRYDVSNDPTTNYVARDPIRHCFIWLVMIWSIPAAGFCLSSSSFGAIRTSESRMHWKRWQQAKKRSIREHETILWWLFFVRTRPLRLRLQLTKLVPTLHPCFPHRLCKIESSSAFISLEKRFDLLRSLRFP
jgi:hypothetical protein